MRGLLQPVLFGSVLSLALVIRLYLVHSLSPGTDVYYFDTRAAQVLLMGGDPYGYTYQGIPGSLLTPGAQNVFAYLPFTALYLVPFYLLGDVRFGFVVADVVVGCYLYLSSGRWKLPVAAIYLLSPLTILLSTAYLNNALMALLLIIIALALESGGRRLLSSVAFGLAIGTSVLAWLVLPFYVYHFRRGRAMESVALFATFAAVVAPFFVAAPGPFLQDVLFFQFQRPVLQFITAVGPMSYDLNLSLSGLMTSFFGVTPPLEMRLLMELGIMIPLLSLARRHRSMALYSSIFLTVTLFVVPNNFLWAYAELPFALGLVWISRLDYRETGDRT